MKTNDVSPAPAVMRDARASARPRTAGRGDCLSIVHIASNGTPEKSQTGKFVTRAYPGASRAEYAGIVCKDPKKNLGTGRRKPAKRGKVTGFSDASRRRLARLLATIEYVASSVTMALTLPMKMKSGDECRDAFRILCRQFEDAWPMVGFAWKRELQKRGAVHYHLLIWGAEKSPGNDVHQWLATRWFRMVGGGDGKHLVWHMHRKNWESVEDMANYFAKYLGKDEKAKAMALPGRWWGFVNRKVIPFVPPCEKAISERVAVFAHRIARKLRQKRCDSGKHKATLRIIYSDKNTRPDWLTQWALEKLRAGYFEGYHDPANASAFLASLTEKQKNSDVRFGKFKFRGFGCKFGRIILLGKVSPLLWARAMTCAVDQSKASKA